MAAVLGAIVLLAVGLRGARAAFASERSDSLELAAAWDRTRSLTVVVLAHATVNATVVATHLMAG